MEFELMLRLDKMDFWSIKCINTGGRHTRGTERGYECRIVHKHKTYTSAANTIASAISYALEKARTENPARRTNRPKLKLASYEAVEGDY